MKHKVLITVLVLAILCFVTGTSYAANGDLIVNGNLGVGTSTPAEKAHISGNMIVDGNTTVNGNFGVGTTTPTEKAEINGNMSVTGNVKVGTTTTPGNAEITGDMSVNGNVGIGTTTPTKKLHVEGDAHVSGQLCVGSDCTNTLHVSGGLYGYCDGAGSTSYCSTVLPPATCYPNYITLHECGCAAGYTRVRLSVFTNYYVGPFSCYKN